MRQWMRQQPMSASPTTVLLTMPDSYAAVTARSDLERLGYEVEVTDGVEDERVRNRPNAPQKVTLRARKDLDDAELEDVAEAMRRLCGELWGEYHGFER
jgi:hypothetical protein